MINGIRFSFLVADLQEVDETVKSEVSKREKARLKEMQRKKNEKIQEILDAQNAAIDADMVRCQLEVITGHNNSSVLSN